MQIKCPECGFSRDVPSEKIPPKAKVATCPKCGEKFRFRTDVPEENKDSDEQSEDFQKESETKEDDQDIWSKLESLNDESTEESGSSFENTSVYSSSLEEVPWENLNKHGFFQGLFQTIKRVMFSPGLFFEQMPLGQGFNRPLIFYLLVAEVQALAQLVWQMLGVVPQMEGQAEGLLGLSLFGLGSVMLLVFYPILLAFMLFVVSGLNHLCLLAVKDGQRGYEGTFKVVSYSSAPMVLAVLPVFGPLLGMFWTMICTFLGFKHVHRTSAGRVVLAMVLPILVFMFLSLLFLGFSR